MTGVKADGVEVTLSPGPFLDAAQQTIGHDPADWGGRSRVFMMNFHMAPDSGGTAPLADVFWMPNSDEDASGAVLSGMYTSFTIDLYHPITCGGTFINSPKNSGMWITKFSKP